MHLQKLGSSQRETVAKETIKGQAQLRVSRVTSQLPERERGIPLQFPSERSYHSGTLSISGNLGLAPFIWTLPILQGNLT